MKDTITVIVPIYKVEAYLDRCILSIMNQSYRELEIILVDDGSPDKCGEICDKYAKLDQRIKVIHKANGGLSEARNVGIDLSSGKYIGFVDSDDYIHPQMYEKLMDMMKKKNADITICNYKRISECSKDKNFYIKNSTIADWTVLNQDETKNLYFDEAKRIIYTIAWNKLYKKKIIGNTRYPKGKVHEDEFTTFKLLYKAKTVVYSNEQLYFYLDRKGSITQEFNQRRFDLLEAYRERMKFYIANKEYLLWKRMVFLYMRMFVQYMKWLEDSNNYNKNLVQEHKKKFETLFLEGKDNVLFTLRDKLEFYLFFYGMPIYRIGWRVIRKLKSRESFVTKKTLLSK